MRFVTRLRKLFSSKENTGSGTCQHICAAVEEVKKKVNKLIR